MPRLRGRRDDLRVIAIRKHGASPPGSGATLADRPVDVLRSRDLKPLHPRRECGLSTGLDEQVHMRPLNRDVDDPDLAEPGRGQRRFPDGVIHAAAAQATHGRHDA